MALCIDPAIHQRRDADWPFDLTDEEFEVDLRDLVSSWGMTATGYDEVLTDEAFIRWDAKLSRCAATPTSIVAFQRAWFESDVRSILSTIGVPTLVLGKTEAGWGKPRGRRERGRSDPRREGRNPRGTRKRDLVRGPRASRVRDRGLPCIRAEEEASVDRVLATVLITDIVESTERQGPSFCRMGRRRKNGSACTPPPSAEQAV